MSAGAAPEPPLRRAWSGCGGPGGSPSASGDGGAGGGGAGGGGDGSSGGGGGGGAAYCAQQVWLDAQLDATDKGSRGPAKPATLLKPPPGLPPGLPPSLTPD